MTSLANWHVTPLSIGGEFRSSLPNQCRGASINDPTVDHPFVFDNENRLLTSGIEQWADEIIALLNAPAKRQNIAAASRASLEHRLSIQALNDRAESIFREIDQAAAQRVATLTPLPDPPPCNGVIPENWQASLLDRWFSERWKYRSHAQRRDHTLTLPDRPPVTPPFGRR